MNDNIMHGCILKGMFGPSLTFYWLKSYLKVKVQNKSLK